MEPDPVVLRRQAWQLTKSWWDRTQPHPLKTVEQITPIVFTLLSRGVEPLTIIGALERARAHTVNGIQVALAEAGVGVPGGRKTPLAYPRPYDPPKASREVVERALEDARNALVPPPTEKKRLPPPQS